ncbi:AraC-like DNA-binding protein [Bradyrhizobium sp. USDA 4518]|uniref:helix-turn-helix domain-containing protein n=1 Tax=unclassified Bradyrhizobium TaxID=2631580 RepID=UPI0020A1DE3B|nr:MULTISPECIES: helix-turn-helix domain-containing protein [unclassified Bradyrhizobium]MCP1834842.1 AraC-like DNA-binding protein [Bradyrhizobium sp. USDA 4545]MCP1919587.1 AraC-like DNA-binding protein [Bradyrhizobium sp. USDA 4532]
MEVDHPAGAWSRLPISSIEDLSDAVRGAGLEATQMSTGRLSGVLAFSEVDGIVCSSGSIEGRVSLFGPLSSNCITTGVAIRIGSGARHWLNEIEAGSVGVFLPGDEHDALYTPGSLYAAVTLSAEKLEHEAAAEELVLDRHSLGGSGIHARCMAPEVLADLRHAFETVHGSSDGFGPSGLTKHLLTTLIAHLARPPRRENRGRHPDLHGKIVERARTYIYDHLSEPISIDELAAAAYASRRTLFRAFSDILDDTPQNYVRRLRLHRIRHDLASDAEKACTIALVANQWGIGDLGRMSGWYRELFGERPRDTVAGSRIASGKLAQTT